MCGTCKFCLGFFQIASVGSFILIVTLTAIFYLYGGMPPVLAMVWGFWIQYCASWLSIYLTFYIVRVLGKGLFTKWTPKYCMAMIIVIIVMYMAVAICFWTQVTTERMVDYSRSYFLKNHERIPNFLDKFQEQYSCCGINNYKDYNNPKVFGPKSPKSRTIDKTLNPNSKEWSTGNGEFPVTVSPGSGTGSGKSSMRNQWYFDVPNSCCKTDRRIKNAFCGKFVEYTRAEYETAKKHLFHPNAAMIVNNVSMGCYKKYKILMDDSKDKVFQLNWLIGITRWGSIIQAVTYFILIWVFRLSLRAMRRNMKGQISLDDDEDDLLPFNFGGETKKKKTVVSIDANPTVKTIPSDVAVGSPEMADVIQDFLTATGGKSHHHHHHHQKIDSVDS